MLMPDPVTTHPVDAALAAEIAARYGVAVPATVQVQTMPARTHSDDPNEGVHWRDRNNTSAAAYQRQLRFAAAARKREAAELKSALADDPTRLAKRPAKARPKPKMTAAERNIAFGLARRARAELQRAKLRAEIEPWVVAGLSIGEMAERRGCNRQRIGAILRQTGLREVYHAAQAKRRGRP